MANFFRRAVAVLVGIVLGMVIVAGAGPWRDRPSKRDISPTPPAPVRHERAPDTRV
jgi:xanthine/uracil permease